MSKGGIPRNATASYLQKKERVVKYGVTTLNTRKGSKQMEKKKSLKSGDQCPGHDTGSGHRCCIGTLGFGFAVPEPKGSARLVCSQTGLVHGSDQPMSRTLRWGLTDPSVAKPRIIYPAFGPGVMAEHEVLQREGFLTGTDIPQEGLRLEPKPRQLPTRTLDLPGNESKRLGAADAELVLSGSGAHPRESSLGYTGALMGPGHPHRRRYHSGRGDER
jgi:hypothetical protein